MSPITHASGHYVEIYHFGAFYSNNLGCHGNRSYVAEFTSKQAIQQRRPIN
jgi:hypothetical protein